MGMHYYMAPLEAITTYTSVSYTHLEVVSDGYFHESEYRSAPYFNVQIDGINLLDTAF